MYTLWCFFVFFWHYEPRSGATSEMGGHPTHFISAEWLAMLGTWEHT
jgi:hypothetical protein